MLIRGRGFSADMSYECRFHEPGVYETSSSALFLSSASLTCVSPSWPHAAITRMDLSENGKEVRVAGATSMLFEYVTGEYWLSASPTSGGAQGGYDITVSGSNFDTNSSEYSMIFSGTDANGMERIVSANCKADDGTRLACKMPPWSFGEASVKCSLKNGDADVGKVGEAFVYSFTPYWSSIVSPTYGGREGGTRVTIAGNAFFPTAANLRCRWQGNSEGPSNGYCDASKCRDTVASVVLSDQVECDTPAWAGHEQTVSLSLFAEVAGKESWVLFIGRPHDAEFRFVASWTSAETTFIVSQPWPLPLSLTPRHLNLSPMNGSSIVTISGFGFDINVGFNQSCRFTCVDDSCGGPSFYEEAALQPHNSTLAYCATPHWTHSQGTLSAVKTILSVVHFDNLPLYHDVNHHFNIFFTRAWTATISAQGPIQGGMEITIKGSNFCNLNYGSSCDNSFKCEFRQLDDAQKREFSKQCFGGTDKGTLCADNSDCSTRLCSPNALITSLGSRILNNTHIVCVVPKWIYSPAKTQIIVYDSSFGDEDFPIAATNSLAFPPLSFQYLAQVAGVSPSHVAVSGEKITVLGTGFVSSESYVCIFGDLGEDKAVFLSTTKITCLAPAIPTGFVAGNVSVSLKTSTASLGLLQNPINLTYKALWYGLGSCTGVRQDICDHSSGPAAGNFSIFVFANGLDPTKRYELRFTSVELTTQMTASLNATLTNSSHLAHVNKWKAPSSETTVTLFEEHGVGWREIALGSGLPARATFKFNPCLLSALSGPYPIQSCAGDCWPAIVTVAGAGLIPQSDSTSERYICELRNAFGNFSTSATSVSPNGDEVRCAFATSGSPPDFVSGIFFLFVIRGGVALKSYDKTIEVHFREGWSDVLCPARGCQGPASGNTVVGIHGFGFNASRNYACMFGNTRSTNVHSNSKQLLRQNQCSMKNLRRL